MNTEAAINVNTSIINEEVDAEDHQTQIKGIAINNSFLKLNEESVNVELDTPRGKNNLMLSKFDGYESKDQILVDEQYDTV